jgi:hypothetical protein
MTGSAIAPVGVETAVQKSAAESAQQVQWTASAQPQAGPPPAAQGQEFAAQMGGARSVEAAAASTPVSTSGVVNYLDGLGRHFSDLANIRHEALRPTGDWGMDMARMMEYNWDLSMTANGCQFALSAAQAANNCSRSVLTPDKG